MAEQTSIAQGLTSILTPLATVGAGVYQAQTKAQINAARIKAGKEPCPGPADCPSIFSSLPPGTPEGDASGSYGPPPSSGVNPLVIVGLLVGLGVVVMLLLPKKPAAASTAPAARRRKRNRKR